tara:strand:+ start:359 stop:733 length:375 start_codon:yes stop_codon:yes gene_type:complete
MPLILIVEDNEMNRDMLMRRLNRRNLETRIAVNGADGVELAKRLSPDLIIMDLSLPVMDGWEATRIIRSIPEVKRTPIIALTAHAMEGDRAKALSAGCDTYETKPVDFDRLMVKIERLLKLRMI